MAVDSTEVLATVGRSDHPRVCGHGSLEDGVDVTWGSALLGPGDSAADSDDPKMAPRLEEPSSPMVLQKGTETKTSVLKIWTKKDHLVLKMYRLHKHVLFETSLASIHKLRLGGRQGADGCMDIGHSSPDHSTRHSPPPSSQTLCTLAGAVCAHSRKDLGS